MENSEEFVPDNDGAVQLVADEVPELERVNV
jgi:hypothetical protein